MNFRKSLAAVLSSAMLCSMLPVVPVNVSAADVCNIDITKTYQTIKGFGGMNHPEWTGADLSDAQRKTAFGNDENDLGLSIVRVYVNDDKNQWYKALETAKYVQEHGGIVFATPWNPPASMTEKFTRTYTTWDGKTMTQENQQRLRHDKYAEYAQHLNDFVHYMRDNGVELYSISIQNEPDYGEDWTWMTEEECVDFLANYADKIDCPVMSPESFSYNKSYYNAILNNAKANANTAIFGTHFYGTSRNNMDFPVLENDPRELFMTEVYVPNSSSDADTWPEAVEVAENIHNGLVVGNMNAYVWWYIRRSYGPMKESGAISKRGYCMAQYSKFVRPGDVRIDATEQPAQDVYISAYKHSDSQIEIVAVNKSTEGYAQQFAIDAQITDVDRYRTAENENLAYTADLEASENSFWAQLPAKSVSTFIVTLEGDVIPTEPKEPTTDENGYFFHDAFEDGADGWTAHGTAELTLSGRTPYQGINALLVQNREKAWNGAQKTLDASVFQPGKNYAFSIDAIYLDGAPRQMMKLSLQYTDAEGNTKYANIASGEAIRGNYIQLSNPSFTIPENAENLVLYIETAEGSGNFYIDEAIGAKEGILPDAPPAVTWRKADVTADGKINIYDLITAKQGLLNEFSSAKAELAADVNEDKAVTVADLILIQKFLLGQITEFPTA